MKYKVAELEGKLLDKAVARCEGITLLDYHGDFEYAENYMERLEYDDYQGRIEPRAWSASTDWAIAGPIIERERIVICPMDNGKSWCAAVRQYDDIYIDMYEGDFASSAATPLIAAMQAYVLHMLGEEIELP